MTIVRLNFKCIETIEHNKPMFRHLNILNMTLISHNLESCVRKNKPREINPIFYSRMIDPLHTPMYKHTSANVSTFTKAKFIKTNDKISSNFKYLCLSYTYFHWFFSPLIFILFSWNISLCTMHGYTLWYSKPTRHNSAKTSDSSAVCGLILSQ